MLSNTALGALFGSTAIVSATEGQFIATEDMAVMGLSSSAFDLEAIQAFAEYEQITAFVERTETFASAVGAQVANGGLDKSGVLMMQAGLAMLTAGLPENLKEHFTDVDTEAFEDAGSRVSQTEITCEAINFSAKRIGQEAAALVERLVSAIVKAYAKYLGKLARNKAAMTKFLENVGKVKGTAKKSKISIGGVGYLSIGKKLSLSEVGTLHKYIVDIAKNKQIAAEIKDFIKLLDSAKVDTKEEIASSVAALENSANTLRNAFTYVYAKGKGIAPTKETGYMDTAEVFVTKPLIGDVMAVVAVPKPGSTDLLFARLTYKEQGKLSKEVPVLSIPDIDKRAKMALDLNEAAIALGEYASLLAELLRTAAKASRALGAKVEKSDVTMADKKTLLSYASDVKSLLAVVKEPNNRLVSHSGQVAAALYGYALASASQYKEEK